MIILFVCASFDTRNNGFFLQTRIGQKSKLFKIYKFRTLKQGQHNLGHLDKNASLFGKLLRKYRLDELPQLFNVLLGHMSFVGPRPDVPGFADQLTDENKIILIVKPGITGEATLKYKNEELLLAQQDDPEKYNRQIIWPDKVKINKQYVENWSFYLDLKIILKTLI